MVGGELGESDKGLLDSESEDEYIPSRQSISDDSITNDDSGDSDNGTETVPNPSLMTAHNQRRVIWKSVSSDSSPLLSPDWLGELPASESSSTPCEYFSRYFDETIMNHIVEQSNLWLDTKSVLLLTNFESAQPIQTVKRWDKTSKSKIDVLCPQAMKTYNKFMGCVDLLDSLLGLYRIRIRSKKYYHRIFFHFLDMTIVTC